MEFWIIVLAFAAVVAIAALVNHVRDKKRREALQAIAPRIGFAFDPKPLQQVPFGGFNFRLFEQGHSRKLYNLLSQNRSDGTQIAIFDYKYTVGRGKNRRTYAQTVFAAQVTITSFYLPKFRLDPEVSWVHGIGKLFGLKDINFERYPKFSKLYLLRGDDEVQIRMRFHGGILEWLEQHPNLCAEGQTSMNNTCMLMWLQNKRVEPERILSFSAAGQELWQRFQGS